MHAWEQKKGELSSATPWHFHSGGGMGGNLESQKLSKGEGAGEVGQAPWLQAGLPCCLPTQLACTSWGSFLICLSFALGGAV